MELTTLILHSLISRAKGLDLADMGVSAVLMVGEDGNLHKERLEIRLPVPAGSRLVSDPASHIRKPQLKHHA